MTSAYAALAMYPAAPLRPAWERLWSAVHVHAPWTPATLTWTDDVHATWIDPACAVGHACGWPIATALADAVAVVGAFTLDLPDADGHRYRSVVVARRAAPIGELVGPDTTAAVNGDDSLTGWISLRVAAGGQWPGRIVSTGAHVESLRLLQAGRADIASIDPLTFAQAERHQPELVAGLHVVGRGPLVPSPAVVVPAPTPSARLAELRAAFAAAVADPAVRARAVLFITGFVPLERDAFDGLTGLVQSD